MNSPNDKRANSNESDDDVDDDAIEGPDTAIPHTMPESGAEFEDASEFAGALKESESNPSLLACRLLCNLADFCQRLPLWRRDQLKRHGYKGEQDGPEKLRVLVDLMLNLAIVKATREFRLSYTEVAQALRLSKTRAWAWLHLLESANILHCVSRGNWRRKLATTYRFAEAVDVAGHSDNATPF